MFFEEEGDSSIAFGSNVPRLMFPMHSAPTRFGIEQVLRGQPHCGPGSYDEHPNVLFLQSHNRKPQSLRGWYFGCRTAEPRQKLEKSTDNPGPANYQSILYKKQQDEYEPFGGICPRFPPGQFHTISPGPGQYGHNLKQNREIEFHHAFGGPRRLKETVKIKCNNGIPEKCSNCRSLHVGDYYENSTQKTLCPRCYNVLKNGNDPLQARAIRGYCKVRDCKAIHEHQFPGFAPKLILQNEKEQRRLKHKEAYLRLHYSD